MISLWPWARAKQREETLNRSVETMAATPEYTLPSQPIRWLHNTRIALRPFVFESDANAVCGFQEETYLLNFPGFRYTPAFANAFRYDLRRAALCPDHGIFVLDNAPESQLRKSPRIAGFLWLVIAQNSWSGERYGYVNNLYVAPSYRNQGMGRELLQQSDDFFRSRDVVNIRLTVTQSNAEAVALYRRNGFNVTRWEMEKKLDK